MVRGRAAAVFLSLAVSVASTAARADEGGVSFWAPGQFGSLAAVPTEPGWTLPVIYYHAREDAGGDVALRRGRRLTLGLDARVDLLFLFPTYTFATPVAGAQAALGVGAAVGHMRVSIDGTLTGPRGRTISGSESDSLTAVSDLYTLGTLKWHRGLHNFMAYTMIGAPVGSYDAGRLANLGTNHWSVDGGAGYTYFDPKRGHEFSAVLGFTHNFENHDTDYRNGVSSHLDWAASQFVSAQTHVGLVGYFYYQLTGDSGDGATQGDFKSRVSAIGPQVGHFFPVGKKKWYVNLKGYYEFDARHRPEGWNVWLTLAIPLSEGK